MQSSLENQIRERAYQLWEASGYQDGAADQHWLAPGDFVIRTEWE